MIPDFSPGRPDRSTTRFPRWSGLALFVCAVIALAGCKDEAIQHYKVPHEQEVVSPHGGMPPGGPVMAKEDRIVAAFVPIGNGNSRFFKMSGKRDLVESAKPAFVQFLEKSVDLQKTPDQWVGLPEGWKYDATPRKMREATFLIPNSSVEVALSTGGGTDLDNVNRWRGFVGLPPVKEEDLAKEIKTQKIGGQDGKLVDVTRPVAETPAEPTWTIPAGWVKSPAAPFSIATFTTGPKEPNARLTVSPFPRYENADVTSNVNRWRGQVGLPDASPEQIRKDLAHLDANGVTADLLDVSGVEARTGTKLRLIVAMLTQGKTTWVIKLIGPDGVVAEQKNAFEAFVKSMKFPPVAGDK
jgi:hypothetical protein